MQTTAILVATAAEYGVTDVQSALRFCRLGPRPQPVIDSPARYVGECRRAARMMGSPLQLEGEGRVDGRLVAVGYRHVSPWRFVESGLAPWLAYWAVAAQRPDIVGSCHNAPPETAYGAFIAGYPAWVVRSGVRLVGRDGQFRRVRGSAFRRLVRQARARRRQSAWQTAEKRGWSLGADLLRAIGRLTAAEQKVALETLPEPQHRGRRVARVRDIDWARVAQVTRDIAGDPTGRVETAWLASPERGEDDGGWCGISPRHQPLTKPALVRWLAPAYPLVGLRQAIRLARGETPATLADGQLSRAEAHGWLATAPEASPAEWLVRTIALEGRAVRSVAVARWLIAVQHRGAWTALTKTRTAHGPAGRDVEFRFIDRIDEIQDVDLAGSVDATFARAAERAGAHWMESNRKDHRLLAAVPPWRIPPKCARVLVTPAELIREGDEMRHCVGGYVPAVEQGQSVIIALNVLGHRSTAELTPSRTVLQHRGQRNTEPHELCERVLRLIIGGRA